MLQLPHREVRRGWRALRPRAPLGVGPADARRSLRLPRPPRRPQVRLGAEEVHGGADRDAQRLEPAGGGFHPCIVC